MAALQTSPEAPAQVRSIAAKIAQWVDRLGAVWVEGQVASLTRRPGMATAFLALRDVAADISLQVTCPPRLLDATGTPIREGARIIVHAKPVFNTRRGTLSLSADDLRPVGVGELLARLERLKAVLAAEGLFATERKQPLPFLPRVVGLVCGRGSAAEHDVLENARRRWPAVRFRVENVAVQGPHAVVEVIGALRRLDGDVDVDVIVVTRGGGSVEDLLPFSDEALVRAVAACRTPVVSAIGHEQDTPLLDAVADLRASTPTDAAKRVVPDVSEQQRLVDGLRDRAHRAITGMLQREQHTVAALRSRPVLVDPQRDLDRRAHEVTDLRDRARRCSTAALDRAADSLRHMQARVAALSPAATLERGYAVVQRADGQVVRRPADVAVGDPIGVRLAQGRITADVTGAPDAAGRSA